MSHCNKGFTLIEVIISSLILFFAISIGTVAYRKTIRLIEKITVGVAIEDALPFIMEIVKSDLMEKKDGGKGNYGKFITFFWSLEEIKSSRNVLGYFDEAAGGGRHGKFLVSLNHIFLNIAYERNGLKKISEYEYKELLCYR
jgi:type II secretory pathway component PulJ